MGPHIWLDPNGSQLLLVIIHTARARDATATATGAQRLTHWGSHFGAKERILCDSCTTLSHMGGTALGWRGEIGRGILERAVLFTFFIGYIQSWKPHPRFYRSNWQPIHLNYTWMRMRTITALQKLESLTLLRVCLSPSFTRSVSLPLPYHLSSFLFHLPLLVFTCQWLLRKCLSRFFFSLFFLSAIYMSVAFPTWWLKWK